MELAKPKKIAPEEYFELETASETKNEFREGEIFAMTGESLRHNLIVSNIVTAFNKALRGKGCFVFPSDLNWQAMR